MDNFEQQSTNETRAAVETIATDHSSLYSTLQNNYDRNNIPSIIVQLLCMYQPEDGITAYERVLKKVQDLLKDCDSCKKQLILSMIPAPKNAPDHTIKEVFRIATGLIKLNTQKNDAFEIDGMTDNNILSSEQNHICDENVNPKLSLSEGFSFRGFDENEISTTMRSHVKNAESSPSQRLSNNLKNWSDGNNKSQMTTYRQCLLNKKYCTPDRIGNDGDSNFLYSPQTVHQDMYSMKTRDSTEITVNFCRDKEPRRCNSRYEYKKCDDTNTFVRDIKSGMLRAFDTDQDATTKRVLEDEIRRMDVCWDEDENVLIDADDFLATARDRLKTSIKNFFKRAQEGTSIESSAFPRTKSFSRMDSSLHFTPEDQKSANARDVTERSSTSVSSSSDSKSCLSLKRLDAQDEINLANNRRMSDEKAKQEASACVTALSQTRCSSHDFTKTTELQLSQNNPDYIVEKKEIPIRCNENDTDGPMSIYGCTMVGLRSNDVNSENNFHRVNSMSELIAYKKRYYDTLLNVQRAKVAVTNSLASSADHLTAYGDPYYSNYAYRQQHLFQQQHPQCATRPQFSTQCPTTLSELSCAYGNQYSWARSDCKYLLMKQLRLGRQTSPVYVRNQGGWLHSHDGPVYPFCSFMPNESDRMKQCVGRKSLEDIVGKLKGVEYSDVND